MSAVSDFRERRTEMLRHIKHEVGCEQCGSKERLHFHHRDPATKEFSITRRSTYALQRIVREIEKCDILCERCHVQKHPASQKELNAAVRLLELNAPELLA